MRQVHAGTILQQSFIAEFIIENFTCEDCHREAAKDTWTSVLQLRQKVDHKRTFYFIEQLILKHNAHDKARPLLSVARRRPRRRFRPCLARVRVSAGAAV